MIWVKSYFKSYTLSFHWFVDGHTIDKMNVSWKKGFDQSKVTDNNYISLAQFEYAVFFEENYQEEIASGKTRNLLSVWKIYIGVTYHNKLIESFEIF